MTTPQRPLGPNHEARLGSKRAAEVRAEHRVTPHQRFGVTPLELEITSGVVAGLSNKEIAKRLSLGEAAVKHHLGNIFDKVGASNRLELALFAVYHRLLEDEPDTPAATG